MIEEIKKTEAGPDSARYIFMGMTHVVKKTDTKTLYYGVNHLDSTTLVTDETGKIVNELTDKTNPFGDQEEKGIFFTGKRWDEDAQLYYFNARFYDPEIGAFLTEDPARDGLLHYAYVSNNPIGFVDPTGNIAIPGDALVIGGLSVLAIAGYQAAVHDEDFGEAVREAGSEIAEAAKAIGQEATDSYIEAKARQVTGQEIPADTIRDMVGSIPNILNDQISEARQKKNRRRLPRDLKETPAGNRVPTEKQSK